MRVFIPSKGRAETISTHLAFSGMDCTIVVHNEMEAAEYRANPTVSPASVVVSGVPADAYGLTRQREWICHNLAQRDEWFVFADDNIKQITAVDEHNYGNERLSTETNQAHWRGVYNAACTPERFMHIANDTIARATQCNAHLCGFATTNNVLFRQKKYRSIGYAIGKLMLWHNVRYLFNHSITMEDFVHTAENLLQHGAVIINNFVFPAAGHYERGGMGNYAERVPHRLRDVKMLLQLYPGLFRVKDRAGFAPNTDVQLRITSRAQLIAWRRAMLQPAQR